jgi:mono/diheme cytochrome c family protein
LDQRFIPDFPARQQGLTAMHMKTAVALGASLMAAVLTAATPATAQGTSGDTVMGQKLAQQWCSNCHAVDAKSTEARDAVPSFLAIARMPSTTHTSLNVWLQTQHPQMPDWELTQAQIADVSAYILSLNEAGTH